MIDPCWTIKMKLDYDLMTDQEISDLPIGELSRDCIIYMFTPKSKVKVAIEILEKWGYTYVNLVPWVKLTVNEKFRVMPDHMFMSCIEHYIVGVKGNVEKWLRRQ